MKNELDSESTIMYYKELNSVYAYQTERFW